MSSNFVCIATPEQGKKIENFFTASGWQKDVPQFTVFRFRQNKNTCSLYKSGKLFVQGNVTEILAEILKPVCPELLPQQNTKILDEFKPHIGIDESGKGDFFGPLVTAAVFVNKNNYSKLLTAGVKDSKLINDKSIAKIAVEIRKICEGNFHCLILNNPTYNRLYDQMQNLNKLLAWCHSTVLENVLEKNPLCEFAISDQFAANKSTLQNALKERGRKINLLQMTKAESDIAVAAASILARDGFITAMKKLSLELQLTQDLPKGASAKVKKTAKDLAKKCGKSFLINCAKIHFKTFNELD